MPAKPKPKIPVPKIRVGRPPKDFEKNKDLILRLAARGFDNAEMSKIVGVTPQTLDNWQNKYPDFFDTLKIQKAMSDEKVERSLYERACGYSHPETKAQWVGDENGGRWETLDMIKHYPPDPTSMIFWLKNRQPDRWRDRVETEHSGNIVLNAQAMKKCQKT